MNRVITALIALSIIAISCIKDPLDNNNGETARIEVYEAFGNKLKTAIPTGEVTLEECAKRIKRLKDVSEAHIEDGLIMFTTKEGIRCSFDVIGETQLGQIQHNDMVDTCGNAISQFIIDYQNNYEQDLPEGVENEPIEQVIIREDDDSIDNSQGTKASAIMHRKVLAKRKMALWCPWVNFYVEDVKLFTKTVNNAGFSYYIFNEFTPSSLQKFSNFDLVYIGSHGCDDGSLVIPGDWSEFYLENYPTDREANDDGIRIHYERINGTEFVVCIALERKYLEKHLPNLSHTILFTSVCHAGRPNSDLLYSAIANGCNEFYGADNTCTGEGPMSVFCQFVPLLSLGASTKVAYNSGLQIFNRKSHSYSYCRYGNKNTTYVKPLITGVKTVSDIEATVGVRFDYSLDIPGVVDENTVNEIGIRLLNLETTEERYIPLSSGNIEYQYGYNQKNIFYSYYADVRLVELEPSTVYEYRTYYKVGNTINMSSFRQNFKTQFSWDNTNWSFSGALDITVGGVYYESIPYKSSINIIDTRKGLFSGTLGYGAEWGSMAVLPDGKLQFDSSLQSQFVSEHAQMIVERTSQTSATGNMTITRTEEGYIIIYKGILKGTLNK